jgi:hypothetical protein
MVHPTASHNLVQTIRPDHSWLITTQLTLFLIGCGGLYFFMYWQSGGREAFYEPQEQKHARWANIFEVGGRAAGLPGALLLPLPQTHLLPLTRWAAVSDGRRISSLCLKCDKAMATLVQDAVLDLSYKELECASGSAPQPP